MSAIAFQKTTAKPSRAFQEKTPQLKLAKIRNNVPQTTLPPKKKKNQQHKQTNIIIGTMKQNCKSITQRTNTKNQNKDQTNRIVP